MNKFGLYLVLVALGALCGCSGDGESSDAAGETMGCATRVTFSGGYQGSISWSEIACGIPFGPSKGVHMIFLPGTEIGSFTVEVNDVAAGETGTFPGRATLRVGSERGWSTEGGTCSIAIDANTFQKHGESGDEYAVHGTGTCSAPAAPEAATDTPVTVGDFEVQFPAIWPPK